MRRLWVACIGVAIIGAVHAGTAAASQFRWLRYAPRTILISPNGRPVAGKWQRWIDESKIPTYRGTMILDASTADTHRFCDWSILAQGCTDNYAMTAPRSWTAQQVDTTPETIINLTDELSVGHLRTDTWTLRDTLYYEQGHVVDWMEATDADRARFMRLWRLPGTPANWDTEEAQYGTPNAAPVPGEVWSAAYEVCAQGPAFNNLQWIRGQQRRDNLGRWALDAQRQSCTLFRSL